MCVRVCVYVCMRVCVRACVRTCVLACVLACVHVRTIAWHQLLTLMLKELEEIGIFDTMIVYLAILLGGMGPLTPVLSCCEVVCN